MKKLMVALMVLVFAGTAAADALDDAVAVWQFADWSDENGPPYTDWSTFTGSTVNVDVSADGIQAPNADNKAVKADTYSYHGADVNPGELVLTGGATIFARHKSGSFNGIDDIIQVGNGATDWNCVYGVSLEDAEPRFIVHGAGQGADEAPLYAGMTVSADTWYDITGVFDPGTIGDNSGTIHLYVYDPMTGDQLAHTSTTVPFDALETDPAILNEIDMFVIFNAWHGLPDSGNMIELSAVWDRALSDKEVAVLSGAAAVGVVTNLNDPMQVREADPDGSAVQFEVVLSGDPPVQAGDTITVVVDPNLSGDGPDEDLILVGADADGTVTLTYTDTTWNAPQTVTVKAIDDDVQDSGFAEVKEIALLSSSALGDPNFTEASFSGAPVAITVLDDESPAIDISKTSVSIDEAGATTESYSLELQVDPASPVIIHVGGTGTDANDPNLPDSLPCQATVNGAGRATLTFSSGDLGPKTVTVAAVDDDLVEVSPHALTLGHVIVTEDADYATATIPNVVVSITDNDARTWSFGDDVSLVGDNFSFEDPALADGSSLVLNDTFVPGHEWHPGGSEMEIINPDLGSGAWDTVYNAGHRAVPDGEQVLALVTNGGTEDFFDVCSYLIEPGPVSYTFTVSVGVPLPADPAASVTVYVSSNAPGTFGRIVNPPPTFSLSGGDLAAGEWVDIQVCGVVEAGSDFIGGVLSVGVAGENVHVDNFQLTVGNHPCEGCTIALDDEQLAMDFDGNCEVNLADFAAFAADFTNCFLYPDCLTGW